MKKIVSREDRMRCRRLCAKLHRQPRLHRFTIRPDGHGRFLLLDIFGYEVVDADDSLSVLEQRIQW